MKRHLPNHASILISTAAVFFAFGHFASGASSNFYFRLGPAKVVPAATNGVPGYATSAARCPRNTTAVSGGWAWSQNTNDDVATYSSAPTTNFGGWSVFEQDFTDISDSDSHGAGRAFVVCES